MADSPADQELADRYAAYLAVCNAHDFDRLGEFVAPDVRVGGVPTGLPAYAESVARVVESFPDYHWRIRHLVVNRSMLAAHLDDSGTHTGTRFLGVEPTGRTVQTLELAVYAWRDGLIAEVWSVTDRLAVQQQLRNDS